MEKQSVEPSGNFTLIFQQKQLVSHLDLNFKHGSSDFKQPPSLCQGSLVQQPVSPFLVPLVSPGHGYLKKDERQPFYFLLPQ